MINVSRAPLSALYLFPRLPEIGTFPSDPPFDESKPLKFWRDPSPVTFAAGVAGLGDVAKYKSYGIVNGKIQAYDFILPLEFARSVNIPPHNWTGGGKKYKEVPFPCRNLEVGETLVITGLGGSDDANNIAVQNDALWKEALGNTAGGVTSSVGFTNDDRQILKIMADTVISLVNRPTESRDYSPQLDRIENMLSQILIKLSISQSATQPLIFR